MKKFVFACLLLLVASAAFAQTTRKVPYPVGPQTYLGFDHDKVNTETYGLRIDGGERTVITPVEVGPAGTAGWFAFEVPFPALTPGLHLLVVDACNIAGCALSDPFAVELVALPAKPGQLRIVIKPGS